MKRLLVAALLILLLSVSEPTLAVADVTGLYLAPKLIWSHQTQANTTRMDNLVAGLTMTPYLFEDAIRSDSVFGGALALGYDFMPTFSWPVRAELEYATRTQARTSSRDMDSGYFMVGQTRKMAVSTLFANVYLDINTGTKLTPYVGGGLGAARINVKDAFDASSAAAGLVASSSKDLTNFAWNLGAGVAYSFDANWKLDLGYRYSDFDTVKGAVGQYAGYYSFQAKSGATAHEVLLGLRYGF